jgi:hypothetical protein
MQAKLMAGVVSHMTLTRILAIMALAGCEQAGSTPPTPAPAPGARPPPAPTTVQPPAPAPHELLATLEREACYGTCPIYKLHVFRDGAIEYAGEEYVKTKGAATGRASSEQIAQLRKAFDDAHYFDLADDYTHVSWTDAPTAITSYRDGARTKTIHHYYGDESAPKSLTALEHAIDDILHTAQWVGTESEREQLRR